MNTKEELENRVFSLAKDIEKGKFNFDIDSCPSVTYKADRWKQYLGATIYVTLGGPNIWIDTERRRVEGRWGNDQASRAYICDKAGIDDYMRNEFDCFFPGEIRVTNIRGAKK